MRLCDFIRKSEPRIRAEWEVFVRERGVVKGLHRPHIQDDVPRLLEQMAYALEALPGAARAWVRGQAEPYAKGWWGEGLDVREVTAEYTLLRATILWLYGAQAGAVLRVEEVVRLDEVIDGALAEAVASCARARRQAQESLAQVDTLLDVVPLSLAAVELDLRLPRPNMLLGLEAGRATELEGPPALVWAEDVHLLRSLLDNTPSPIFVKDREGRYLLSNAAFARAVGVSEAQLVGRDDFALYPRATAEVVRANDAEVVRRGEALWLEERIPQKDGLHTYLTVKFPILRHDGRLAAVCGIATDITHRKRAEEELQRTAELRERFLGVVSHDLRNPLNAISVSAGLLLNAGGTPPCVDRAVRRIAASAERMRRMVEELLDFTRVRLGAGLPLAFQRLNLYEVVRSVLDEATLSAPMRDLVLTHEGELVGEWDADRLAQMLGNLVRNALDYSPEGSPIRVSLWGVGGEVRMEIHNKGEPIPPESLATLFEPFRSAAGARRSSRGGLGLGLYIVKEICAAHGGRIEVASNAEEGTCFRVVLPRRPLPAGQADGAAAAPSAAAP